MWLERGISQMMLGVQKVKLPALLKLRCIQYLAPSFLHPKANISGNNSQKLTRGDVSAFIQLFFLVSLECRKSLKMLPPNGKLRCGGVVCRNSDPKPRFIHGDMWSRDEAVCASKMCPCRAETPCKPAPGSFTGTV